MLDDEKWRNKAKGIKKCVTKNLKSHEFEACLMDRERVIVKGQHVFRNRLHQIYTENIRKSALNGNDDKRFIRLDGIRTYAWGHVRILEEEEQQEEIEMLENDFLSEN